MKLRIKIALTDDRGQPFMGIGVMWLLQRIKKFGSINEAAKDMRMSYVKASRILRDAEKKLGKKLLVKKQGGVSGGGAKLTPFGRKFTDEYDKFQKEVKRTAQKSFHRFVKKVFQICRTQEHQKRQYEAK